MNVSDPTDTFRQEARELLEQLEAGLLDLEQDPANSDLINFAFRALHTIKGSGAMFGFTRVAEFVHEFETAFDRVRKGQSAANKALIEVALEAKDHIHRLIEEPDAEVSGGNEILATLRIIVDGGTPARESDKVVEAPLADTAPSADAPTWWRLVFYLPSDCLAFGTNPILLLEELAELGPNRVLALTDRIPDLDSLDPEVPHIGWQVDIEAADPAAAIDDIFMFLRDSMELTLSRLEDAAPASDADVPEEVTPVAVAEAPAATAKPPAKRTKPADRAEPDRTAATSLRVPAERLDELMDRVGELVIAQARLTQIAATSSDTALKTIAEELERLSSGLRDTSMGIRMVPIGSLFGRFRRLVHDLSGELGKPIEFVTAGEDTELDKTMIERLADPLVHLIRNAMDHGLESAQARAASGKPAKGTVRLSAVYSGAEVAISVSDDGAGLDASRIRAKAEENGLITPDTKLTEQELYHLIFAPGFSTAKEVTSLSGRGVGMDVVKRTIDGLRGTIDLTTIPGQGTTATLRLPLTLAIIDGMLVRVGNGRYTIPLAAVEECVELPEGIEAHAKGRNFLDIRGSLVPYLRLREVFGTSAPPEPFQKVVIVSSGDGRVGLVVDQIIGNNQTVIKQLSKLHSSIKSFSGATILGDGTVALILDTAHLVASGQPQGEGYSLSGRAA
ncbi:chemotaxis protein CheA [Pelagibacterium halotolerans]|uniref:Chemotaxis protein CheA n=1 Tax=Pelagibacterium halotolerans (strain DSM 22347 / JCM 15775 / CGMCC 1.7692 / B2) TaxID=1082931 RepID=G4RBL5_PELHB|nr:chemotaxis protein CheA [Pelagibacterium halotolerans]AEQ53656.1 signal transduction histidine kinase CheA [Pelagibacterium halotolerans B2]QJR20173.1 chemotaxis protein CheA [Pelagibacterium halotolerans]SEA90847.1 two-component system, chemotaxis family, sensor kinase CheA [Pelagibacterium halotolerans]